MIAVAFSFDAAPRLAHALNQPNPS